MPAIKVNNYQNITQFYANAQIAVQGVTEYYFNAAYEIVALTVFDPELDLLAPFYNAYVASQVVFLQAPASVITAVSALQRHILDKARTDAGLDATGLENRFTDINQWIDAEGSNDAVLYDAVGRKDDIDTSFTVANDFATLSTQAGFTIVSANIT